MQVRPSAPSWGLRATLAMALVCAAVLPAAAQPKKGKDTGPSAVPAVADKSDKGEKASAKKPKEKNFDFNALDLNGKNRTPQLLYFLERANEELERATLEKRSFIPRMVRSVDEEAL